MFKNIGFKGSQDSKDAKLVPVNITAILEQFKAIILPN